MTNILWWRDDDAGPDDPRLARLIELSETRARPLALAVIPARLEPAAIARIRAARRVTVIQHGVAHDDHGVDGAKKIELGGGVDRERLRADVADGKARLEAAFGDQFRPVMAPPWNRIDPDVETLLPELGFNGLSCFGGPLRSGAVRRIDTHVDAVDWEGGSVPRPADVLEAELSRALADVPGTAIGLLTHHLVVNGDAWGDLDRVLGFGHDLQDVKWASAAELFGDP